METTVTCPFGSECETIKENKIHRCAWYVTIKGKNPQTGEDLPDTSSCAMSWIPILLVENNKAINGVAASAESSRNVVAEALMQTLPIMGIPK